MAIYLVTTPKEKRLVKSDTKAAAINHVIRPGVTAEAVSAEDLADMMTGGMKVETAVADKEAA